MMFWGGFNGFKYTKLNWFEFNNFVEKDMLEQMPLHVALHLTLSLTAQVLYDLAFSMENYSKKL